MSKLTLIEDYHPVPYWLENDNSLGYVIRVMFNRSSRFRVTDHVNFAPKADVGCRVYEYTP